MTAGQLILFILVFLTFFSARSDTSVSEWSIAIENSKSVFARETCKIRYTCTWRHPTSMLQVCGFFEESALFVSDVFQRYLCESQQSEGGETVDGPPFYDRLMVFADDGQDDKTHCGIGCRFMRLTMAFWQALHDESMLVSAPKGSWTYTHVSECPSRNEECYFQPLSKDTTHTWNVDSVALDALQTTRTNSLGNLKTLFQSADMTLWTRSSLDAFRYQHNFGQSWLNELPNFTQTYGKSGCWFAGQLLYFLLSPNKQMNERLLAEKRRLNWESSGRDCIAVHVRHGWRARFNARLTMKDFMKSIRRYQSRNVLLITEDQSVIDDAKQNFPEYNWMYTNYPRDNKHDIGIAMEKGEIDPTPEAINALLNLYLSSECRYHVGRVNSTWFRLMIMLAYGRYGTMPLFDNLQEDWGHGGVHKWGFFGMCTLREVRKEVAILKKQFPSVVSMDLSKIV
ncbi:Fuct6p protein [Pseudoscourfieldia marina]